MSSNQWKPRHTGIMAPSLGRYKHGYFPMQKPSGSAAGMQRRSRGTCDGDGAGQAFGHQLALATLGGRMTSERQPNRGGLAHTGAATPTLKGGVQTLTEMTGYCLQQGRDNGQPAARQLKGGKSGCDNGYAVICPCQLPACVCGTVGVYQLSSMPTPQTVCVPRYCLMAGLPQPPNGVKSLKLRELS